MPQAWSKIIFLAVAPMCVLTPSLLYLHSIVQVLIGGVIGLGKKSRQKIIFNVSRPNAEIIATDRRNQTRGGTTARLVFDAGPGKSRDWGD